MAAALGAARIGDLEKGFAQGETKQNALATVERGIPRKFILAKAFRRP